LCTALAWEAEIPRKWAESDLGILEDLLSGALPDAAGLVDLRNPTP
jgi:hypothetical protein